MCDQPILMGISNVHGLIYHDKPRLKDPNYPLIKVVKVN